MAGEPEGRSRRRARLALLVGLAVLVPGILIAAAVALGGQRSAATVTAPVGTQVAAAAAPAAPAPARPRPSLSAIPGGRGALVATVVHPTNLLGSPGGHAKIARLLTKTQFGSP
jgi:hypothetical protein